MLTGKLKWFKPKEQPKKPTTIISDPSFWAIVFAWDANDQELAYENFEKVREENFNDGIEYAKDTVNEWHRP
jgi:hypothetical protein